MKYVNNNRSNTTVRDGVQLHFASYMNDKSMYARLRVRVSALRCTYIQWRAQEFGVGGDVIH
jgi:hypothetical protein